MATAEARVFNEKHGIPVVFANRKTGAPMWSEAFENNPRILKNPAPKQKCVVIRGHGAGHRPYHNGYDGERFYWNYDWKAIPGELWLSKQEKATGVPGAVLIEPHTKNTPLSKNKAWEWDRWQRLVDSLPLPWVQLGAPDMPSLNGVKRIKTKSYREALGFVNQCSLLVATDGALHHTAAALGKPAVVLWGGLAPPSILGYPAHRNLCHATYWCGLNAPCEHCKEAMSKISVDEVVEAVREMRQ